MPFLLNMQKETPADKRRMSRKYIIYAFFRLFEISVEQTFERLAVTCFVARHFMDGVIGM